MDERFCPTNIVCGWPARGRRSGLKMPLPRCSRLVMSGASDQVLIPGSADVDRRFSFPCSAVFTDGKWRWSTCLLLLTVWPDSAFALWPDSGEGVLSHVRESSILPARGGSLCCRARFCLCEARMYVEYVLSRDFGIRGSSFKARAGGIRAIRVKGAAVSSMGTDSEATWMINCSKIFV